ncbi:MAG: DNA-directed RNA polymerase subunit delta [Syntrophomonas sp.]|uniref:DNA-directed RNA polymerase subunit delta n=1 Tax=Syntrophomonas sp. TaxID=2053627 RepID=UPI00260A5E54|nr:DNA-directed RNA polymerase subunit delta [Syntrophomonas sp.]MDD2511118.1 DNA-directed RNA polymerase subunit delta [Syntrophomonas sp.]MDD3878376.1 DNA-directed RNA polymerase subunit delta [Syntrophomonas sp.]MDD4625525.1 DNA-directed RNA polymerase subunit delta [Syntrophomonas sp.]
MMPRKKSEADWAVDILSEKQEAMFYADLIKEVAKMMGKKKDPGSLTSIYTRINLDNRLVHQGQGYWYFDTNRVRKDA